MGPTLFDADMRHSAVTVHGAELDVYFTTVGDSPERIRRSTIHLADDWMKWESFSSNRRATS